MSLSAQLAAFNMVHPTRVKDDGEASSSSSVCVPSLSNSVSSIESDDNKFSGLRILTKDLPSVSPLSSGRQNEHLAVLLPKHLWKPDTAASHCDTFTCPKSFTMLERRHHCRKCGGVFCKSCSSRSTSLLDTSNLSFLYPPRNIPIAFYHSANSPVAPARVCDDCFDQLKGTPSCTPDLVPTSPISVVGVSSETSSLMSALNTPPHSRSPVARRRQLPTVIESEPSFGELDAYPLRRSSALCKATGGGRWEPKPIKTPTGSRIPCGDSASWGKAPFELDMEREEEEERLKRSNPIVRDGDFQYRFARRYDHPSLEVGPYVSASSTF